MSGGVARISPLAGKPAPRDILVDPARLEREYYDRRPDPGDPSQLVRFGTSGHRGSPLRGSFNEAHIAAITQAICEYRRGQGIDGPLVMGKDTHGVSTPAQRTAVEVLAANGIETIIQRDDGVTPTPVVSRAILVHNRGRTSGLSDGIVVTPSHNPPEDGGFKYNPPSGGPADTDATGWIQNRANELLRAGNAGVKRRPFAAAVKAATTHQEDLVLPYVKDLENVVEMDAIRGAGLKLGVDPLGGAARPYWEPIEESRHGRDDRASRPTGRGVRSARADRRHVPRREDQHHGKPSRPARGLRAPREAAIIVDGENVIPQVHAVLDKMADCADRIRSGAWRGHTGQRIRNVVNIGIGGSEHVEIVGIAHPRHGPSRSRGTASPRRRCRSAPCCPRW